VAHISESTHMPRRTEAHFKSPEDRRREITAVLGKGVVRWRRRFRSLSGDGVRDHANSPKEMPESAADRPNGLELSDDPRLSVSHSTRGLNLREIGDDT
jgi:hypothetical protein